MLNYHINIWLYNELNLPMWYSSPAGCLVLKCNTKESPSVLPSKLYFKNSPPVNDASAISLSAIENKLINKISLMLLFCKIIIKIFGQL